MEDSAEWTLSLGKIHQKSEGYELFNASFLDSDSGEDVHVDGQNDGPLPDLGNDDANGTSFIFSRLVCNRSVCLTSYLDKSQQ